MRVFVVVIVTVYPRRNRPFRVISGDSAASVMLVCGMQSFPRSHTVIEDNVTIQNHSPTTHTGRAAKCFC